MPMRGAMIHRKGKYPSLRGEIDSGALTLCITLTRTCQAARPPDLRNEHRHLLDLIVLMCDHTCGPIGPQAGRSTNQQEVNPDDVLHHRAPHAGVPEGVGC